MKITLANRISYVTRTLKQRGFEDIRLKTYKPGVNPCSGFFRIHALKGGFRIYITELLLDGKITKYSYTLLRNDEVILRYDNAPHHPEIPTHPHHKHVKGSITPLQEPMIEKFIDEAITLITTD